MIVSQAVAAVEAVNRGAKGFANAVLRNYLRSARSGWPKPSSVTIMESPDLVGRAYLQRAARVVEAILRGGNGHGLVYYLRVNRRRATVAQLLEAFTARKIDAEALSESMLVLKAATAGGASTGLPRRLVLGAGRRRATSGAAARREGRHAGAGRPRRAGARRRTFWSWPIASSPRSISTPSAASGLPKTLRGWARCRRACCRRG